MAAEVCSDVCGGAGFAGIGERDLRVHSSPPVAGPFVPLCGRESRFEHVGGAQGRSRLGQIAPQTGMDAGEEGGSAEAGFVRIAVSQVWEA